MRKQLDQEEIGMDEQRFLPSASRFLKGRFSFLLISLLFFFLLHTFLAGHHLARYFLPTLLLVTLITNIHLFGDNRMASLVASVLGLATLVLRWTTLVSENQVLLLIGEGTGALFFVFIALTILAAVLRAKTVTGDIVSGALCVYLLIGMVWAFLFMLLESVHPGSFQLGEGATTVADSVHRRSAYLSLFLYFSFVTLSTVGYGDILPLTPPAHGLAALEGVIGQFYMAVLVARFVGLHLVHSQR